MFCHHVLSFYFGASLFVDSNDFISNTKNVFQVRYSVADVLRERVSKLEYRSSETGK